jgi:hypothetical protein
MALFPPVYQRQCRTQGLYSFSLSNYRKLATLPGLSMEFDEFLVNQRLFLDPNAKCERIPLELGFY